MKTKHVFTKSRLPIPVVDVDHGGRRRRHAYEHPLPVRLAHWSSAATLVIMTGSGLQIFAAFPSFGSKIPQHDLVNVPAAFRLGDWLGGALQWHLTFMWVFMGLGIVYLVYQAVSGRWRQTMVRRRDIPGVLPMARHYFLFRPRPEQRESYNPLQKLAYTVAIDLAAMMVLTGWMLYKPVQLRWLVWLSGGFGMVRMWHFIAMCGLLVFIPGHLAMVAIHGWNNFASMLTGWKRDPDYF